MFLLFSTLHFVSNSQFDIHCTHITPYPSFHITSLALITFYYFYILKVYDIYILFSNYDSVSLLYL